jgi:hypothetical protein
LKIDENNAPNKNFAVGLNLPDLICHLNIEGISASKNDYLSRLMREP